MPRLILAVSADGYLARSVNDDMEWTGGEDKAIFRLLTSQGDGMCGVGRTTYKRLPRLPGRRVVPLSRRQKHVSNCDVRPSIHRAQEAVPERADLVSAMTLDDFAVRFPTGWLLGGPAIAMAALRKDLVSEVYLCRSCAVLSERGQPFDQGIPDGVTPFLFNYGPKWHIASKIKFVGVQVDVWKRRG